MGLHTGVELAESKTDETVIVGVLNEGLGESSGHLDSLLRNRGTTNVDGVSDDVTGGTGAVTVRDHPSGTLQWLRGGALGRSVNVVLTNGLLGELR